MKRPVHFEILAEDPAKLAEFYRAVFGWEIADWGGSDQTYWVATTGPDSEPGINGGFMGRALDQAVIITLEVESLAEAASKIEAAGGKVIHGPNEVTGVGTHAYFADSEGILFGVMQPAN